MQKMYLQRKTEIVPTKRRIRSQTFSCPHCDSRYETLEELLEDDGRLREWSEAEAVTTRGSSELNAKKAAPGCPQGASKPGVRPQPVLIMITELRRTTVSVRDNAYPMLIQLLMSGWF